MVQYIIIVFFMDNNLIQLSEFSIIRNILSLINSDIRPPTLFPVFTEYEQYIETKHCSLVRDLSHKLLHTMRQCSTIRCYGNKKLQ
jgi:hypothetical protein